MFFEPSSIPEVVLITPQVFGDDRGFFMETYQAQGFGAAGLPFIYVQDNHSGSQQGTLRGLHYQIRQPQGKIVRVLVGEIYDVVVDLRRSSATFSKWLGIELSAKNKKQIWIPPGFAHGFYVLSEWAEVAYKATDYYAPQWERTLLWNDPALNISWPISEGDEPILSMKDRVGKLLADAEVYDQEIK
ncbi:MAG: dTDP-4-dehydrorhamnose 3,5-epimerase [Chloroflexi bacterium RBG_19FT_COMBO_47_9]|nr:MAG: dTDP-4-dehydrorhamnose 3,5-epimerase [Chloroflexi bacterium RBG_19FT_COMBO_47_9]